MSTLEIVNHVVSTNGNAFAVSVRHGLNDGIHQKSLEPKYFYDDTGSLIFEEITQVEEYYLTRAEAEILSLYTKDITHFFANVDEPIIVELGSGSSIKTRTIIASVLAEKKRLLYIPIDISESMLRESSEQLLRDFPGLSIFGVAAEYTEGLKIVGQRFGQRPKLILWLGSSIGNLQRVESYQFLDKVRKACMTEQDRILIGMDLKKDKQVLIHAYDDSKGVTAKFNKNVLSRINAMFGADFDVDSFEHKAVWNDAEGRIEMHLRSTKDQVVTVKALALVVPFRAGETIHTESCHKYDQTDIETTASRSGLKVDRQWFDQQHRFSLNLFAPGKVETRGA